MENTNTCEDCGVETNDPHILNVSHPLFDTRTVCCDCSDDYSTCESCGIEVHSDDACPLTDEGAPEGCESYGCAPCAGYRLTSYGWVKA